MEELNNNLHLQILDFNKIKREQWMRERKPYSVLFELTSKCNMNCIHCYLKNNHFSHKLSLENVLEIIDALYDIGILFITFTGGEILTRSDFLDIYLYAKKKGFLVELFSNGYLFNDDIIEVLKEYPPLLVDISIYGSNEDTYRKVTGISGAFDKVISNCVKLKNAGIRVSLRTPVIKPTLPELEEMKKLAEDIKIPFVYTFDICSTIDKDNSPKSLAVPLNVIFENEFLDYYCQIEIDGRKKLIYDRLRQSEIKQLKETKYVYACNVALNSFIIDYEGNICPCMKLRHRGKKFSKETFNSIWKSFECFSKKIASDSYPCKGCDARYFCDVCPAEMDCLYNDDEFRPNNICTIAKIRRDFYTEQITFEEAIKTASFYDKK